MPQLLTSNPWRARLTCAAMSLFLAWHTLAMMLAPLPDTLELTRRGRALFEPYLTLLRLDHGWDFFSPVVVAGTQFRYVIEDAAGASHTFIPTDTLSRFHPMSHWIRDRYDGVMAVPEIYADATAAALCREHVGLHPVTITLLAVKQMEFSPDDLRNGHHPLDPDFIEVTTLKSIQCPNE